MNSPEGNDEEKLILLTFIRSQFIKRLKRGRSWSKLAKLGSYTPRRSCCPRGYIPGQNDKLVDGHDSSDVVDHGELRPTSIHGEVCI